MTLPLTRNRTYAPGMEVVSADLNALQDAAFAAPAACAVALFSDGASGATWTITGANAICWSEYWGTAVMANLTNGTFQHAKGWGFAGSASTFTPGVTINASSVGSIVAFGSYIVAGYGCSSSSTNRVCVSTDGGLTFAPASLPWAGTAAIRVATNKDWIIAVDITTRTVARSTNGSSWSNVGTMNAGTVPDARWKWASDPTTGTIVSANTAWSRSTDGGATWSAVTIPITTTHGVTWDYSSGLFYAIGLVSGVRTAYTSPDGITWTLAAHSIRATAMSTSGVIAPVGSRFGMVASTNSVEFLAKMHGAENWVICRPSVASMDDLAFSDGGWLGVANDSAIFGTRMA